MFDFSGESEQSTGTGCIPDDSVVLYELNIRKPGPPEAGRRDKRTSDPFVSQSATGIFYLDCELVVVSGQFEGRKIYELIPLPITMQSAQLDDGQRKWCGGGGAKLRAVVESLRNIDPKDKSRDAMTGRAIVGWHEIDRVRIPVKVGYKKIEDGDQYVNNRIKAVITPNREEYAMVMQGGEVITDKPIPQINAAPQQQNGQYGGYQQSNGPAPGPEDYGQYQNQNGSDDVPF